MCLQNSWMCNLGLGLEASGLSLETCGVGLRKKSCLHH